MQPDSIINDHGPSIVWRPGHWTVTDVGIVGGPKTDVGILGGGLTQWQADRAIGLIQSAFECPSVRPPPIPKLTPTFSNIEANTNNIKTPKPTPIVTFESSSNTLPTFLHARRPFITKNAAYFTEIAKQNYHGDILQQPEQQSSDAQIL